jgi:hypothetical protein
MDRGGSGMSCNRPSVALGESIPALTERLNAEHRLWLRQLRAASGARTGTAPPSRAPWQPTPIAPARSCQWPVSSDRPWRMCGEPSRLGYSFCLEHARQAFVRMCEEDDAA